MNFKELFGEEWYEALKHVIESDYWKKIGNAIGEERNIRTIYPEKNSKLLFKAFRTTPLSKVKVVILGQDPYHDGSFDGFAFSNTIKSTTKRISPSLVNILHELHDDICTYSDDFGEWLAEQVDYITNLEDWAKQGVLLINTAHTVVRGVPDSHTWLWKYFTIEVIKTILRKRENVVWILWGRRAQKLFWDTVPIIREEKGEYITTLNLVLESAHPSPFSAYQGFFGSKPFSKTNEFLEKNNITIINW